MKDEAESRTYSNRPVVKAKTAVLPGCARPWRTPCATQIHNHLRIAIESMKWREMQGRRGRRCDEATWLDTASAITGNAA